MKIYFLLLFSIIALGGCMGTGRDISGESVGERDIVVPVMPVEVVREEGSLWSEFDNNGFLYNDLKARQVGDIITINIDENAKGSKDASTKTSKDSSISTGIDAFFGLPTENRGVGASSANSTAGTGSTSRSGKLTANMTASVIKVLPNGNLVISGDRKVVINAEEQIIRLTGIIRAADISPQNEISSQYIANAKIEYTGEGVIADKQRVGWGIRLIDLVWPF